MTSNAPITLITDLQMAEEVRLFITGIVDDPWTLNIGWLSNNNFVAVPGGTDLNRYDNQDFVGALAAIGCVEYYGVDAELERVNVRCYKVEASQEGLRAIIHEFEGLSSVFIPKNRSFVVLQTPEYFVMAGPKAFVEKALGVDIATARAWFDEDVQVDLISKSESSRRFGEWLREVANRYTSLGES